MSIELGNIDTGYRPIIAQDLLSPTPRCSASAFVIDLDYCIKKNIQENVHISGDNRPVTSSSSTEIRPNLE